MTKTILLTGATDGIGFETARKLVADGHKVLMHGRSAAKLDAARAEVGGVTEGYLADLSKLSEMRAMASAIRAAHGRLDVVINNAGILKAPQVVTADGLDIRFVVNTFAPYVLTQELLLLMGAQGRVVNLSSAAQAPVNTDAMAGDVQMADMDAYAQSKLAITIWSRVMAAELPDGPVVVAVNPGSLLASKMVKEGFGIAGNDLSVGADILCRAALSAEFADASGKYFDNDAGRFGPPHPDALDDAKCAQVMAAMKDVIAGMRA